jgi:cell division protein FtsL
MIRALLNHRMRGFRTLNIVLGATLLILAISVNLAKTIAGRERNEIGQVEVDMNKERKRIRLLEAEVAHLEQPERLERLARGHLELAPLAARQEANIDTLSTLAVQQPRPQPVSTVSVAVP